MHIGCRHIPRRLLFLYYILYYIHYGLWGSTILCSQAHAHSTSTNDNLLMRMTKLPLFNREPFVDYLILLCRYLYYYCCYIGIMYRLLIIINITYVIISLDKNAFKMYLNTLEETQGFK